MAQFKEIAQEHHKALFSPSGLTAMMENQKAYQAYKESLRLSNEKTPNITEPEGVDIYKRSGGSISPVKQMTEAPPVEEEENDNDLA